MNDVTLRILGLLSRNPRREFYQREISRLAKVSVGATNYTMKKLSSLDIVIEKKMGKMRLYKINKNNPLVHYMKISLNILDLLPLVSELKKLTKRIVLFGSCADGTDTESSDIDLLIITESEKKPLIRKMIIRYNNRIERKISPIIKTKREWLQIKRTNKAFYNEVERGIVLWSL